MAGNINRVVLVGQPDEGPGAQAHAVRDARLLAAPRGQHPPQGRVRASGRTSRTTSTSPSGASRARTAPSTSRRAGRWRSTGASSGASGRPRTARSARPSRSSPRASSSSAGARTPRARHYVPAGDGRRRRRLPRLTRRRRHPVLVPGPNIPPARHIRSRDDPSKRLLRSRIAASPGDQKWLKRNSNRAAAPDRLPPRQAQELPLLPRQGAGDRLQEPRAAAAVHLREGEDPLPPYHRRVPPSPDPGRRGGEAGAREMALLPYVGGA